MWSTSVQKQILGLAGWLVVSFAASAVGAIASIQAKSFYGQLVQPDWAPPPGVFGPVWTVLFALMGVAAAGLSARVRDPRTRRIAATLVILFGLYSLFRFIQ